MKKPLLLLASLLFFASCSKEPCEDLEGSEKVSCVQCEELGNSNYFQIVEKPADFPTINMDSLYRYGRDSNAYFGGTASYEIGYGQDQCPGDDIYGYIYINFNSSIRSTDKVSVGELDSKSSRKFRYKVFPNGTVGTL